MKQLIALLLTFAMIFTLAACGGGETKEQPEETKSAEQTQAATEQTEAAPESELLEHEFTHDLGQSKITIVGAEAVVNEDEEDILRVYYDYTNTTSSAAFQAPNHTVQVLSVMQDGIELESGYIDSDDEEFKPEDREDDLTPLPGCTVRKTLLYLFDPQGGPVTYKLSLIVGSWVYEEDKLETFTFEMDPANLMGAPAEPLVYPTMSDPTYTKDYPSEAVCTDCYNAHSAAIQDYYDVFEADGETCLRVYIDYSYTDTQAWPPGITMDIMAYQDGVSLEQFSTFYLDEVLETDEAFDEDLEPGENVLCSVIYTLRTDSPVVIAIEKPTCDTRIGSVFEVAGKLVQQEETQSSTDIPQILGAWSDGEYMGVSFEFRADMTGIHIIGSSEYPFTYELEGTTLYVLYDDGDDNEYEVAFDGAALILTDLFDNVLILPPVVEETPTETTQPEETESAQTEPAETNPFDTDLVGTWYDEETAYEEVFTFNNDGTGKYSYKEYGVVYEFTFTYSFYRSDYVDIFYDDGDIGGFQFRIEGNTMYVTNDYVTDMPMVRK